MEKGRVSVDAVVDSEKGVLIYFNRLKCCLPSRSSLGLVSCVAIPVIVNW